MNDALTMDESDEMTEDKSTGAAQFPPDKDVFDTKDAATYLGLDLRRMKTYLHSKPARIEADGYLGKSLYFKRATLDAWKREYEENMDIDTAARYLGIPRNRLKYYIYWYTPVDGRLKPTGKRGNRPLFTKEALQPFREKRQWMRHESDEQDHKERVSA